MRYTTFGSQTGLRVSEYALGAGNFGTRWGSGATLDEARAVFDAFRQSPGCTLLDVDPGASTDRTVYTFVCPPEAMVDAALAGARVAHRLIDMQKLADEAFRDLMKEPRRSTTAKQSPCGQQLFGGLAPSIGRDHGRLP